MDHSPQRPHIFVDNEGQFRRIRPPAVFVDNRGRFHHRPPAAAFAERRPIGVPYQRPDGSWWVKEGPGRFRRAKAPEGAARGGDAHPPGASRAGAPGAMERARAVIESIRRGEGSIALLSREVAGLTDDELAALLAGLGVEARGGRDENMTTLAGAIAATAGKRPARSEAKWRREPAIAAFGDRLHIRDIEAGPVQAHLSHLTKIPPALARKVVGLLRGGVHLGNSGVPGLDDLGELAGKHPPGTPEGTTWEDVPGCFHAEKRVVAAGHTTKFGYATTVLHEIGHAAGCLLGPKGGYERSPEFLALHRRAFARLQRPGGSPLTQDGPGGILGAGETFADAFAWALVDEKFAREKFGDEIHQFIKAVIEEHSK